MHGPVYNFVYKFIRHNIDNFVAWSVPQFSIDFERCVVVNNSLKDVTNEGEIFDFVSTQNIIVKNSNFSFNEGTAISLRQSNIKFSGIRVSRALL